MKVKAEALHAEVKAEAEAEKNSAFPCQMISNHIQQKAAIADRKSVDNHLLYPTLSLPSPLSPSEGSFGSVRIH